jgi:hypothetical protein
MAAANLRQHANTMETARHRAPIQVGIVAPVRVQRLLQQQHISVKENSRPHPVS